MENEYLRHTLSTIEYRLQKILENTVMGFGNFSLSHGSRTPNEIINHMYHVLSATRIYLLTEKHNKELPEKLSFELEIDRFNLELKNIDSVLAEKDLGIDYTKRLLQGPFSDILTHVGQIAMLSRLFGNPIKGEDFSSAFISTGIY
ncbi:MAG: hypothetical protein PF445_06020 [Melioribacteraceae bacterium]|jgi:hypothetical protein|nr:hypothetical protein [Melioribacteraceae bacterium]